MYYAKVFLDEDNHDTRYIHVIEDRGDYAVRIAWISTRSRHIYKCVKQRLPILERTETMMCIRDRLLVDDLPERPDPNPETPWYERLARLGLDPTIEEILRRTMENTNIPAVPARYFVVSLTEREHGMVARARISW